MCVGVEFLAFNVLVHTKSEQKVTGYWFCAPIIFKNSLETDLQKEQVRLFLKENKAHIFLH